MLHYLTVKVNSQVKKCLPFPWLVITIYTRTRLKGEEYSKYVKSYRPAKGSTNKLTGPTCIQIPRGKLNLMYKLNTDRFRELKDNISTYNHVNSTLSMLVYNYDSLRHLGLLSNQPNWYLVFSLYLRLASLAFWLLTGDKYFIRTLFCFISRHFRQKN